MGKFVRLVLDFVLFSLERLPDAQLNLILAIEGLNLDFDDAFIKIFVVVLLVVGRGTQAPEDDAEQALREEGTYEQQNPCTLTFNI